MTPEPPNNGIEEPREMPRPAYDVCNPDRLPADRVAFVDGIHQHFLQSFGEAMAAYLDAPVEAIPAGVDQVTVAAFLEASAGDPVVISLHLEPMRSRGWIALTQGFVFRVLDVLLGTPQTAAPGARTTVTEIEQHVLREFFQTLVASLAEAWASNGITLRMDSLGTAEEAAQADRKSVV